MGRGLLDFIADTISDWYWTDERIGKYGEKLTEKKLKLVDLFGRKGKILKNIYIPKENGETSEIDLVFITQKGIFVLESKNYSGWIFGDYRSMYWTSSLPNGEKNKFYNPIKQNKTHIKWLNTYLERFVNVNINTFSIIVFSERCELKKIPDDSVNIVVCKRDDLYWRIRDIWGNCPDIFNKNDIESIFDALLPLSNVSEVEKQAHINNINMKTGKVQVPYENIESVGVPQSADEMNAEEVLICPKCGGKLVLRTAKKGSNSGNQFYGCSIFPKCRFIQSL